MRASLRGGGEADVVPGVEIVVVTGSEAVGVTEGKTVELFSVVFPLLLLLSPTPRPIAMAARQTTMMITAITSVRSDDRFLRDFEVISFESMTLDDNDDDTKINLRDSLK